MLTHIDLFSGIGGFALAAQWAGFRTVAFVEIEPYAQEVIKERFGAVADTKSVGCETRAMDGEQHQEMGLQVGAISGGRARLYSDIFTFDGTIYRGATLLTGGFPCQPFSQAGKRRGKEDDRYLWPEMLRVISEARPAWVIGENVAGIVTMELDRVLSDLEGEGYAVQALIIPACAVDAKHRRDRVWIVGHAAELRCDTDRSQRGSVEQGKREGRMQQSTGTSEDVAESKGAECERQGRGAEQGCRQGGFANGSETLADAARLQQGRQKQRAIGERVGECGEPKQCLEREAICESRWLPEPAMGLLADGLSPDLVRQGSFSQWPQEPEIGRVATGIKNRVDQLKGLGNSIVPQVAYEIIKGIAEIERGLNESHEIREAAHR